MDLKKPTVIHTHAESDTWHWEHRDHDCLGIKATVDGDRINVGWVDTENGEWYVKSGYEQHLPTPFNNYYKGMT